MMGQRERWTVMRARVNLDDEALAVFCREHGIRTLAFFGSVLRADFRRESDVDVLVEFELGRIVGCPTLAKLEHEFCRLVGGRRVHMRTPQELSPRFRADVIAEADVRFAASDDVTRLRHALGNRDAGSRCRVPHQAFAPGPHGAECGPRGTDTPRIAR